MKIKTSELTGKALEYCVIRLEHPKLEYGKDYGQHWASDQIVVTTMEEPDCYSPFSSWKYCGPIIEREKITIVNCYGDLGEAPNYWVATKESNFWEYGYGPYHEQDEERSLRIMKPDVMIGTTPLIAAMRCYVASKIGDVVEIPDSLA